MPAYTIPISGVINEIFEREGGSIKGEEDFFSVARTIPLVAVVVSDEYGRSH
jgi:hypothetical protein